MVKGEVIIWINKNERNYITPLLHKDVFKFTNICCIMGHLFQDKGQKVFTFLIIAFLQIQTE